MPSGRSTEYAIWKACERFGILPPGCETEWDAMTPWPQSMLLGYDSVRQQEDHEYEMAVLKARAGV